MKHHRAYFAGLLVLATSLSFAEKKKTRDQMVREDRQTLQSDQSWIYNDLPRAIEIASKTKKPLLIVFR
ncbi:MAG: hypothetical protein QGG53_27555 [Planctomycetota bacterium]|jgi:hypothetical protein|nr:hypothetical protein [Planctomycetota bacterium]